MSLKPVLQNVFQIVQSIDESIKNGRLTPSLILLYSGIDIMSSLSVDVNKEVNKGDFISWTTKYMIPHIGTSLTGADLYAARCGVVHSLRSDSNMSKTGRARQIVYAVKDEEFVFMQKTFNMLKMDYLAVKISDLSNAFKIGIDAFFKDISQDADSKKIVLQRAEHIFEYSDLKEVKSIYHEYKLPGYEEVDMTDTTNNGDS